MQLGEAIRNGSQLRGESRGVLVDGELRHAPFVRIANTDELRSDPWGAACEAVHSLVAKRNWNLSNKLEYDSDTEYLREIQQKYFERYFKMPAACPGAKSRVYAEGGGRFTGRIIGGLNEVAIEGERQRVIAGVTNACSLIANLAELIEHAFYVHNWSREECAQAAEWYEEIGGMSMIERNFEHYQDATLRRRISEKLTTVARQRELQRHQRRRVFAN